VSAVAGRNAVTQRRGSYMFKCKMIGAMAVVFAVAGMAQGATVTFDFAGPPGSFTSQPSLTFTDPGTGMSVTATGGKFAVGGIDMHNVSQSPAGLGVDSEASGIERLEINGADPLLIPLLGDEVLALTFSIESTVNLIGFQRVDDGFFGFNPDSARIWAGDNLIPVHEELSDFGTGFVLYDLAAALTDPADRTGLTLYVSAVNHNDDFTVRGLRIVAMPVPGPAGMGLALMGIAAATRRRRRA